MVTDAAVGSFADLHEFLHDANIRSRSKQSSIAADFCLDHCFSARLIALFHSKNWVDLSSSLNSRRVLLHGCWRRNTLMSIVSMRHRPHGSVLVHPVVRYSSTEVRGCAQVDQLLIVTTSYRVCLELLLFWGNLVLLIFFRLILLVAIIKIMMRCLLEDSSRFLAFDTLTAGKSTSPIS